MSSPLSASLLTAAHSSLLLPLLLFLSHCSTSPHFLRYCSSVFCLLLSCFLVFSSVFVCGSGSSSCLYHLVLVQDGVVVPLRPLLMIISVFLHPISRSFTFSSSYSSCSLTSSSPPHHPSPTPPPPPPRLAFPLYRLPPLLSLFFTPLPFHAHPRLFC